MSFIGMFPGIPKSLVTKTDLKRLADSGLTCPDVDDPNTAKYFFIGWPEGEEWVEVLQGIIHRSKGKLSHFIIHSCMCDLEPYFPGGGALFITGEKAFEIDIGRWLDLLIADPNNVKWEQYRYGYYHNI